MKNLCSGSARQALLWDRFMAEGRKRSGELAIETDQHIIVETLVRVEIMAPFADDVETPPNRERVLVSDLRSDTSGEGLETALVATDASRGGVLVVH